jgi:hypothetical protein
MQLKVQGIANDPIKKIGIVTLVDVLDDFPQVSASVKLVTLGSQTQAEILTTLKGEIKALLEEAIRGLDRFADICAEVVPQVGAARTLPSRSLDCAPSPADFGRFGDWPSA